MYPTRLFRLLLVAIGFLTVAQAAWFDSPRIPRRELEKRQSGTASGADVPGTSSTPGVDTSTSAPPPGTSSTSVSTTAPPPTTSSPSRPASTTSTPTSTTTGPAETTSTTSTTSQTPVVKTSTTVIVVTNSDGKVTSITSESTTTSTPGLTDENNAGTTGMPTNTRNIVIGVVVGVGGAIVLGALAFVAFRIWGRKKTADENDGLMDYPPAYSGSTEPKPVSDVASSAGTARSPFQSTLESYHAPTNHPVNASSNF